MVCPECEYSLEGLPEEGDCPECGRAYDQSIVIVRCHGPGPYKQNPLQLSIITLAFLAGSATLGVMSPAILKASPQLGLALAFIGVMCAMTWIDRAISPRAGVWLLWIAPQGIGVQTEFDPSSMLARARKWIPMIWFPMYLFAGFIPLIGMGQWIIPAVLGTTFVIAMVFFMRLMRVKPDVPASGAQPALIGWSKLTRIELLERRQRGYRLRAMRQTWVARGRVIDVSFEATQDYAARLKAHIEALSGQKVL